MIRTLHHVNIVTDDLPGLTRFYARLGLTVGYRPGFPARSGMAEDPGAWLYWGQDPIVHLNVPSPAERAQPGYCAYNHVGYGVVGTLGDVSRRLTFLGIRHEVFGPVPGSHRALYFEGPAGERVELVFLDEPRVPLVGTADPIGTDLIVA